MRVVAAKLSVEDAKAVAQYKARAAEAAEYCLAAKADAAMQWNPANLDVALQFQRLLEQATWELDDIHRLLNNFETGRFHDNVVQWQLHRTVEHFAALVHRAAQSHGTERGSPLIHRLPTVFARILPPPSSPSRLTASCPPETHEHTAHTPQPSSRRHRQ
jgi:hypothetical protein